MADEKADQRPPLSPVSPAEGRTHEATVKQLRWEVPAARSAAAFALRYAHECCRHTEAVSECPHCNLAFLARWATQAASVVDEAAALVLRPSEDWQPIETAPKDHSTVIGYYLKLPERWIRVGLGCVFHGEWMWHQDGPWGPATHWRPLPPAPGTEDR
jgi:hypothetical protein